MSADVSRWLDALGLGKYAARFDEHEVDLAALPELTDADLRELGLPLGPRRRILTAAAELGARTAPPPPGETPVPAPGVPRWLAERALAERHALVGERKQVTILFADIKDSTAVVRDLDPEDADRALRPALQSMVDAIHRFEGTVNRLQGDGLMAMFGAPLAHEDHALRACHAALAMREDLAGDDGLPIRIGLHSGEVVVRAIGNDLSMNYDALGLGAHLAARMEQMAEPGSICMSADTWRLVEGWVDARHLGARTVKGLDAPVETWRLESVAAVRNRLDVARRRGLTPFVGREAELRMLEDRFATARAGRGQVVALVAEPGMGKSRLLHEFRLCLGHAVEWSGGGALSFGGDMAFRPLIELLRQRFGIESADGDDAIAAKIDAGVAAAGADPDRDAPYLRYLLSVDPGDPAVLELDSRIRRQAVFDAARRLLLVAARTRPQVIVFEDLHWADPGTEAFLEFFATGVSGAPVLLLLTWRPERRRPDPAGGARTTIALSSLDESDTVAMTRSLLRGPEVSDELVRHVARHTDGNPFFIEELTRSMLEEGALQRQADAGAPRAPPAGVAVPRTLQDLLAARIDRLGHEAREALHLAAVIGREFAGALVERLAGPGPDPGRALRTLEASGLVYEKAAHPEPVYAFKHALTQDVAYGSMLRERRAELHARVGLALEAIHPGQPAEHWEVLALHFERGGVVDKAVEYLEKAAARAVGAFAVPAALELYRRALALIGPEAASPLAAKRVTFHRARANLHFLVGNYPAARTEWERLLAICREGGDRFHEAGALAGAAWATQWDEDFEQAMRYAGEAVRLAREVGNESARAGGLVVSGYIPAVTARLEEARQVLEQAVQVGRAAGDVVQEVIARFALGSLRNWQGDFDEALEVAGEGLRIARERKVLALLIRTLWVNGLARTGRGDFDAAKALLEEGSELAQRVGDESMTPRLLNTLGWLHLECQDFERGIALNVQAAGHARARRHAVSVEMETYSHINHADALMAMGSMDDAREVYDRARGVVSNPKTHPWMKWRYSTHLFASLAEYWLARGQPGKAREPLAQNMVLARDTNSRKYLAIGHRIEARLALSDLRLDDAETAVRRALALAERIRNPGQRWRCHELLADVLERHGRTDEARDARRAAGLVVRAVMDGLADDHLRGCLAGSPATQPLLEAAADVP